MNERLAPEEVRKMHAYCRAANYLSVGQMYLCDNPLLREPLKLEHVKRMLLGHWGTTPRAGVGRSALGLDAFLRSPQIWHGLFAVHEVLSKLLQR